MARLSTLCSPARLLRAAALAVLVIDLGCRGGTQPIVIGLAGPHIVLAGGP